MHTFRMLGGTGLSDSEGREVDALLRRPKHVALLAYLASPRPGTWHRRDSVLAAFWGEQDQSRARSSLRSALHTLRGHLPEGAVKSRGDDELSIDPALVATDVAAMTDDAASGKLEEALAKYRGELLPGLFVSDAPGFEKWLEQERTRVRGIARKAADQLCALFEKSGDLSGAIEAARHAWLLEPDDEGAARRLIALLDRSGDRSQAFAVYDQFRNHLNETFGVRPSAETVALLDAIRTRHEPSTPATPPPPAANPSVAAAGVSATPAQHDPIRRKRIRLYWVAAPVALAILAWPAFRGGNSLSLIPKFGTTASITGARIFVVLPMSNETGDTSLAYVASGIADGVARKLEGIGGLTVRSGARSDWSDSTGDVRELGRRFGSNMLLKTAIRRVNDSLEVRASLMDTVTAQERRISSHRFDMTEIRNVEGRIAADIIAAVFRAPIPTDPRKPDRPVDPESYRLTLEGWHQLFLRPPAGAGQARQKASALFTKAIDIDPLNARAWSGMSSVWASLVVIDGVSFADGHPRAVAASLHALAIDSLEGTALANLALMRAYEHEDIAPALDLIRKAESAEPSNPEVFLIKSLIFRSAHLYDKARDAALIARQLDPLSSFYAQHAAEVEFCMGRPEAALRLHQSELALNPSNHLAQASVTRGLALLGRYDEAIASWRTWAFMTGDTALASELASVKGRDGYWNTTHARGRKRLESLSSESGRVRYLSRVQAGFQTGDAELGYRELAKAAEAGTRGLYRLACMPAIDEFRDTPRFKAAAARFKLRSGDQKS